MIQWTAPPSALFLILQILSDISEYLLSIFSKCFYMVSRSFSTLASFTQSTNRSVAMASSSFVG